MYTWVNELGEKRKRSILERLRKEAVRGHRNIRLPGEGGVGGSEGSIGQNYGFEAQAALQGYVQNLTGGGGGGHGSGHGSGHGHGGHGHGPPQSHSSTFAPSYGSGGFPSVPGIPNQLPSLFGGSGHGRREGPGEEISQPSPYASSYAPAEPSYGEGSYRSIPEPSADRPSVYASPYAPSYAPNQPEPSGGGYQPSYDLAPRQFGFSGGVGTDGYGGFGGGRSWEPQPRTQNDEENSDYGGGDSVAPGFPNPQRGYGF